MNEFSPEQESKIKNAILKSLENGATVVRACKAAKINRDTFYTWLKKDAAFFEAVQIAKESRIEVAEDALFNNIIKGNPASIIFFLCNRASSRWRNVQKVEAKITELPSIKIQIVRTAKDAEGN